MVRFSACIAVWALWALYPVLAGPSSDPEAERDGGGLRRGPRGFLWSEDLVQKMDESPAQLGAFVRDSFGGLWRSATRVRGSLAKELKAAGYSLGDLKAAGFSAADVRSVGFSLPELRDAQYTATDLRIAGFSVTDLQDWFSVESLRLAGFSARSLLEANTTCKTLHDAGFEAGALLGAGVSLADLQQAGVSAGEIRASSQRRSSRLKSWVFGSVVFLPPLVFSAARPLATLVAG